MKKVYERVCPVCGVKFNTENKQKQYCSKKCNKKAWYIKSVCGGVKLQFNPIPCANCGRKFTPKSRNNRFCSHQCDVNYHNHVIEKEKEKGIAIDDGKLSQTGKIFCNLWVRLRLSNGLVAQNAEPYTLEKCAEVYGVTTEEVQKALDEYDEAHKNGTEREFYKT